MIEHQKQLFDWSCVHACVAMLTDLPQEKVIRYCERKYYLVEQGVPQSTTHQLLNDLGLMFNQFVYPNIVTDGYHMVTVPSLNIKGGNHCIIIHSEDCGSFTVFDPCKGREGKDFYTVEKLRGWSEVVFVRPGGRKPKDWNGLTSDAHELLNDTKND